MINAPPSALVVLYNRLIVTAAHDGSVRAPGNKDFTSCVAREAVHAPAWQLAWPGARPSRNMT